MKQYVKQFNNSDKRIDELINDYLEENSTHKIDKIFTLYNGEFSDAVLVVFNVEEPPTYGVADGRCLSTLNNSNSTRIPEFENGKSMKDCTICKIRDFCKDFGDGGIHTCQEVYQIYLQHKEK